MRRSAREPGDNLGQAPGQQLNLLIPWLRSTHLVLCRQVNLQSSQANFLQGLGYVAHFMAISAAGPGIGQQNGFACVGVSGEVSLQQDIIRGNRLQALIQDEARFVFVHQAIIDRHLAVLTILSYGVSDVRRTNTDGRVYGWGRPVARCRHSQQRGYSSRAAQRREFYVTNRIRSLGLGCTYQDCAHSQFAAALEHSDDVAVFAHEIWRFYISCAAPFPQSQYDGTMAPIAEYNLDAVRRQTVKWLRTRTSTRSENYHEHSHFKRWHQNRL